MDGSRTAAAPPLPPLPYPEDARPAYPPPVPAAALGDRVTPQVLLLGAGVVAVLGAVLSVFTVGTPAGVVAVCALLVVAAALAVLAGYVGTPTAGEALAVASVVAAGALVVVGARTAPRPELAAGTLALLVAVGTGALRLVAPQLRTWPVAAWAAGQVAVLVAVRAVELRSDLLTGVLLGVALTGLAIAWAGRGVVALAGLLGSVPWWLTGVWAAERAAWGGDRPAVAAGFAVAASLGLLVTTHPRVPRLPVAGPLVPVLAGVVAGSTVAGAAASAGPRWVLGAGFLGLALAALVAVAASRGPDWVPRDAGLSAAATLVLLSAVGTGRAGRWGDLGLLMVTTAAAAVLLSVRDRDTRPSTVPIAVGTVALAVVLLTSEGPVSGAAVGAALVAVAVAALAEAVVLAVVLPWWADQRVRAWVRQRVGRGPRPVTGRVDDVRDAFAAADTGRTETPVGAAGPDPDSPDVRAAGSAAVTGSVVGLLGTGVALSSGRPGVTAVLLAVLGLALMGHGDVTRGTKPPDVPAEDQDTRGRGTRVLGGLCLVAAAWTGAALAGWSVPEVVPVAAGAVLLAGTWRALPHGASWPSWGPGLAVALLPSVALAVLDPTPARQVGTLVASLVLVLGGLGWAVRAPFVLGLVGVLGVTVGWLADGAPTPWVVALFAVGAVLLLVGAVRERQRRRGDPVPALVRTFR
ncbi:SCO7613 C-terminal domain-containing membrane protein [Klenkia taihuensis]|uniref:Uncharacterized protein n=1 Tax=Klenkia taihuensis TaxID=1225127 RepID=A0A1I1QFS0_9ACTN|nr:hypothetical protein [Klenkia taihuensis]GHE07846.1 hypothetical protein GCM10011381_06110 [Klenkia taihuensis]SFD20857.1 hypothetical protein SAMN05661030_2760 [Klenkia taihuensis]